MKATVDRKQLKHYTMQAKRTAGRRATLPILSHVRLTATGDSLDLTATDLGLHYRARLDSDGGDAGETAVPIAALHTMVGKLDGDQVTFALDDDGDTLRLSDGEANLTLRTGQVEDWPADPIQEGEEGETFTLDPDRVQAAITAASTDEGRPVLTGVLFNGPDGELASTDDYRMVRADVDRTFGWTSLIPAGDLKRILQAKPGKLTAAGFQVGTGGVDGRAERVVFVSEDARQTWTTRTIEGQFPNYQALWPNETQATITAGRRKLTKALDRADALAKTAANTPVTLEPDMDAGKAVELTVSNQEVGQVSEQVDAELDGDVPPIAFNPAFAQQLVDLMDADQVTVELRDGLKPAIIRDGGPVAALLMPMRVN